MIQRLRLFKKRRLKKWGLSWLLLGVLLGFGMWVTYPLGHRLPSSINSTFIQQSVERLLP